jgi:hypothetical protein
MEVIALGESALRESSLGESVLAINPNNKGKGILYVCVCMAQSLAIDANK